MKWIVLVLVLANAGLYLWVNGHHAYEVAPSAAGEADINIEGMANSNRFETGDLFGVGLTYTYPDTGELVRQLEMEDEPEQMQYATMIISYQSGLRQ